MNSIVLKLMFACIIYVNRVNGKSLAKEGFQWQESGFFQGDMALTPEQQKAVMSRNMLFLDQVERFWPNHMLIVYFSPQITERQRQQIGAVFNHLTSRTCIRVREKLPEDKYYVNITNDIDGGCWSVFGRTYPNENGIGQRLNLAEPGCFTFSTIYHEFLHALGMVHMQSDPTREGKVIINLDNVLPKERYNFDILDFVSSYDFPYDYESVMHYDAYSFAIDRNIPTMWRNTQDENLRYVLGNNNGPTEMDIAKLNFMYPCS